MRHALFLAVTTSTVALLAALEPAHGETPRSAEPITSVVTVDPAAPAPEPAPTTPAATMSPAVAVPTEIGPIAPRSLASTDPATPPPAAPPPTVATPAPPAAPPPTVATPAPPAVADPVLAAIRDRAPRLSDVHKDDAAAITAVYAGRTAPLFVAHGTWNGRAEATLVELSRADDWGLEAGLYAVARPAPGADPAALAEAELRLVTAVLLYVRHASAGRVDPGSLSRVNDLRATPADPAAVLAALAADEKPSSVLLSVHPRHTQYRKLQAALVAARRAVSGPPSAEAAAAEAVPVSAVGPVLKQGMSHPDVVSLRARLGLPPGELYDEAVTAAVIAFQTKRGLKPTGLVGPVTRAALVGTDAGKAGATADRTAQRIVLAMERWRWLPRDLGAMHIVNNIPEFRTRVFKDGVVLLEERIIVGKTTTPTPQFSAEMRTVVFQPEWGVPDSIKVKELWPALKRRSADDLFGFGGADTRILQRYNMRVVQNGRVVDASRIDWSQTDPRRFSFIQAAGGANVLGVVKFLFPNRHDVYMHDTPQRDLFGNAVRAYSHGCMRVANPRRLAEVILANAESEPWSADRVGSAIASRGTQEVKLDRPFPVHTVYMTAWVDPATGKVDTFADLYGHDARLAAALAGKPFQVEDPATQATLTAEVRRRTGTTRSTEASTTLGDIFSGLFAN
jgi:murein L,D-transpeptidase YcbB/YkuD